MEIPKQIEEALSKGLIAAIAQEADSNEVLMMAWMNQEALRKTIETRRATYFSRSRNEIWIKGETSGNVQEVLEIKFDCDGDAVLLRIKQTGSACHTGQKSCFHNEL
ncbi:MAG: phosphoribosyl-AMP cyclohydrolase [Candidatus Nanopelagicaceae bacterium]|nr:phosphoribosyl-AMP cyclohydrolase [Candidatus Nanopelagicaceae bacterium]